MPAMPHEPGLGSMIGGLSFTNFRHSQHLNIGSLTQPFRTPWRSTVILSLADCT
jgi:hypothetical protein